MIKKLLGLILLLSSLCVYSGNNYNILDNTTVTVTNLTTTGIAGIGGSTNSVAVLTVGATNPLTGTDQTDILADITGTSAATASITGMQVRAATAAAVFANTTTTSLRVFAPTAGAGSTIARAISIRAPMPTAGGTGNATLADATSFTGNWFIYQTVRGDSQFNGHQLFTGTSPSITTGASDCGTAPTVSGNDNVGIITVGSSTNGGVCTITFANAWPFRPVCIVQNETTANLTRATATSTTLFKVTGVFVAGDTLSYICKGAT